MKTTTNVTLRRFNTGDTMAVFDRKHTRRHVYHNPTVSSIDRLTEVVFEYVFCRGWIVRPWTGVGVGWRARPPIMDANLYDPKDQDE